MTRTVLLALAGLFVVPLVPAVMFPMYALWYFQAEGRPVASAADFASLFLMFGSLGYFIALVITVCAGVPAMAFLVSVNRLRRWPVQLCGLLIGVVAGAGLFVQADVFSLLFWGFVGVASAGVYWPFIRRPALQWAARRKSRNRDRVPTGP